MPRNATRAVLALLFASLLAARTARADDKADVLKAAKSWASSVVDGDVKTLRAHSSGPEAEIVRWETMSKMFASFQKLTDAVTAKYGEQANLSKMFKRPDFARIGDDDKIEVTGADATLTSEGAKSPMKLKKDAGQWKVVLASFPEAAKLEPKQMTPLTDAISTTADEIKDGQHATFNDAMKALTAKMSKAKSGQ